MKVKGVLLSLKHNQDDFEVEELKVNPPFCGLARA